MFTFCLKILYLDDFRLANNSLTTAVLFEFFSCFTKFPTGCGMFGMWNLMDVECSGCGMIRLWDVRDVRCLGC